MTEGRSCLASSWWPVVFKWILSGCLNLSGNSLAVSRMILPAPKATILAESRTVKKGSRKKRRTRWADGMASFLAKGRRGVKRLQRFTGGEET